MWFIVGLAASYYNMVPMGVCWRSDVDWGHLRSALGWEINGVVLSTKLTSRSSINFLLVASTAARVYAQSHVVEQLGNF